MKLAQHKRLVTGGVVLLVLLIAQPRVVKAIGPFPALVFDPTNWATAVESLAKDVAILGQEVQVVSNTYEQIQQTIKFHGTVKFYLQEIAQHALWVIQRKEMQANQTASRYGETTPWQGAMNSGSGSRPAWTVATQPLTSVDLTWIPKDPARQLQLEGLATIEVMDGAGADGIYATGHFREQQLANKQKLDDIERKRESTAAADNTWIGQANITNAYLEALAHNGVTTDNMLASVNQNQIALMKAERYKMMSAMQTNSDWLRRQSGPGFNLGQTNAMRQRCCVFGQ